MAKQYNDKLTIYVKVDGSTASFTFKTKKEQKAFIKGLSITGWTKYWFTEIVKQKSDLYGY